jgi:hypothetical protein
MAGQSSWRALAAALGPILGVFCYRADTPHGHSSKCCARPQLLPQLCPSTAPLPPHKSCALLLRSILHFSSASHNCPPRNLPIVATASLLPACLPACLPPLVMPVAHAPARLATDGGLAEGRARVALACRGDARVVPVVVRAHLLRVLDLHEGMKQGGR